MSLRSVALGLFAVALLIPVPVQAQQACKVRRGRP